MNRQPTTALAIRVQIVLPLTAGLVIVGCVTRGNLNDYRHLQQRRSELALTKDENTRRKNKSQQIDQLHGRDIRCNQTGYEYGYNDYEIECMVSAMTMMCFIFDLIRH